MRRTALLVSLLVTSGLLVALPAAPAGAGEIDPAGSVYAGSYTEAFFPAHDGWLDAQERLTGRRLTFTGTFHSITENDGAQGTWSNTRELMAEAWRGGSTPFSNVSINDSAYNIAIGRWDAKIREWASHVKQYLDIDFVEDPTWAKPNVIIAPLQEMNLSPSTFGVPYGCDPGNFRTAFRRFVDIFRGMGIDETRVRFAWAPNGWTSPGCGSLADYYPGPAYVDVIAFSAFNFGASCIANSTYWGSPYYVLHDPLEELRAFAPTKPVIIAQTGVPPSSCGGDRSQWLRDLFRFVAADPNAVGFVYFNFDKTADGETDWRVWSPTWADQGWIDGMKASSTRYEWPLRDWFSPGPITVNPPPGPCPDGANCDTVAFVDTGAMWYRHQGLGAADPIDRFFYGNPGDVPFTGDWNCDGVATPGLYRQSDGFVYLRNSNTQGNADIRFFFGNPGDIPIPGDFNGDGCDTLSIYRPSQGRFFIVNRLGRDEQGLGASDTDFYFGNPGDSPFYGDFDGDGITEIGLYRRSTGFVYFRNTLTTGPADFAFYYGNPGDIIMAGDWDGDGDDTVAVYRPADGTLYLNFDNAPGAADYTLPVGTFERATRG